MWLHKHKMLLTCERVRNLKKKLIVATVVLGWGIWPTNALNGRSITDLLTLKQIHFHVLKPKAALLHPRHLLIIM